MIQAKNTLETPLGLKLDFLECRVRGFGVSEGAAFGEEVFAYATIKLVKLDPDWI